MCLQNSVILELQQTFWRLFWSIVLYLKNKKWRPSSENFLVMLLTFECVFGNIN